MSMELVFVMVESQVQRAYQVAFAWSWLVRIVWTSDRFQCDPNIIVFWRTSIVTHNLPEQPMPSIVHWLCRQVTFLLQ
jgi:hypothetical protein